MDQLGIKTADVKEDGFATGMLPDSQSLGDPGKVTSDGKFEPEWMPAFKKGHIDGVLVIAGDSHHSVTKALDKALSTLHHTVSEVINTFGHTRPGKEDGHEHFGFEDGISNPAVEGVTPDLSQEGTVNPG